MYFSFYQVSVIRSRNHLEMLTGKFKLRGILKLENWIRLAWLHMAHINIVDYFYVFIEVTLAFRTMRTVWAAKLGKFTTFIVTMPPQGSVLLIGSTTVTASECSHTSTTWHRSLHEVRAWNWKYQCVMDHSLPAETCKKIKCIRVRYTL